jgi:hypothetical protein
MANMNFTQFKEQIETLAKSSENNLRNIQALITKYYKRIGIIEFDSANMYVVRASRNDKQEVFKSIERCSYNPNFDSIPLQRCNYPSQPVFYCSMYTESDNASTSFTCIMETAFDEIRNYKISKSYYTLSRWDLTRPLKLWVLPFSKLSHKQNKDFKFMSNELMQSLEKHENKIEIISSFKYMSEVFCKRNNKKIYYKISSAFFNYLLFSQKVSMRYCDGLAYPSANTERAGMNVALKRELVDEKILQCSSGTIFSLTRNSENNNKIRVLPCSETSIPDLLGKFSFNIFENVKEDFS